MMSASSRPPAPAPRHAAAVPAPAAPPRWRWWLLAGVVALGLALALRAALGVHAESLEGRARRALADVSARRPIEPRAVATPSALALEAEARTIAIELAPLGSGRGRGQHLPAILASTHETLLAMLLEGRLLSEHAPRLADWLRHEDADITALARSIVSREAPAWPGVARAGASLDPPAGERADRILVESARLASVLDAAPSDDDAALVPPGGPRLGALVLLHEILVLHALEHGRADDRTGASQSLRAAERVLEGLLDAPDAATLGVGVHLSRLHALALRQLGFDEWPRGILDARLEDMAARVLAMEASRLAPDAHVTARRGALLARPLGAKRDASTRLAIAGILQRMDDQPCEVQARSAWAEATGTAPWWDGALAARLGDLADLPRRAARSDIDRELTRRVMDRRAGGAHGSASRCPDRVFREGGTPDAPRLRYAGPLPAIERPMPFDVPIEAVP